MSALLRMLAQRWQEPSQAEQSTTDSCATALDIKGLTVSYGSAPAVFSVDFTLPVGAMGAIIGPNGAGKSTMIKALLGIVPHISGDIRAFGQAVPEVLSRIAYVPQRAAIDWDFPATAEDVVSMGLYRQTGWLRCWRRPSRKILKDCLGRVGMEDFASQQIGQLSGGQQQRVFMARALAQQADLYVLDEPFAGVDAATERTIAQVLKSLTGEGKTVLCVHHDLSTVPDYFEHVLLLNIRHIAAGRVHDAFTPEHLQQAYGGKLATVQLEGLAHALAAHAHGPSPVITP